MRNVALSGVTVIFGAVLLLGYLTISLAARMALTIGPKDRFLQPARYESPTALSASPSEV